MFSSPNNNGHNLFGPFNPNRTAAAATTASFITHVENPSSDHPAASSFLPHSAAFLDNGNDSLMSQLLFQRQGILMNSSCNDIYSSTSAANISNTVSKQKDSKKVTSNNSCEPKKKKKRSVGASDHGGATAKNPVVPRRRTGKKDRHSKIHTAQGPRDRRMRLSLQIARKFFDLQDMLGFDKASKTIEWLFSKSKASIKELKESKAVSSGGGNEKQKGEMDMDETLKGLAKRREKDLEKSPSMKESRDKARERARERTTMKKMKIMMRTPSSGLEMIKDTFFGSQETNSNHLDHQLGSSGTSQETLEDLGSCSLETRTPIDIVAEQEQGEEESSSVHILEHSVSIIEKFLGIRCDSSSLSTFGYSNNIGNSKGVTSEESYTDLSGNWNIMINEAIDHHYPTGYCSTMRGNLKGTTSGNVFQVQNPNAGLGCPDQNRNFSFPMAITSSASACITRPINEETNPSSSSVSIYDYLSY